MNRRPRPGETDAHLFGKFLVAGLLSNANVARDWSRSHFGDPDKSIDLTTTFESVVEAAERVNRGDLSHVEAILAAQTVTLNALFVDLARRAQLSELGSTEERYLRLAFKAQSQCRATAETLAEMKNPPVFTRQANIAGQQLVNNGVITQASRARENESVPKELMEAHGERLDAGAASSAGKGDQGLAAVGALDRPADGGRQGEVLAERLPRGPTADHAAVRSAAEAARGR